MGSNQRFDGCDLSKVSTRFRIFRTFKQEIEVINHFFELVCIDNTNIHVLELTVDCICKLLYCNIEKRQTKENMYNTYANGIFEVVVVVITLLVPAVLLPR